MLFLIALPTAFPFDYIGSRLSFFTIHYNRINYNHINYNLTVIVSAHFQIHDDKRHKNHSCKKQTRIGKCRIDTVKRSRA